MSNFEYYDVPKEKGIKSYHFNEANYGYFISIPDTVKTITFDDRLEVKNLQKIWLPKHFENTEVHDKLKSLIQDNTKIIFHTNDPDDGCEDLNTECN